MSSSRPPSSTLRLGNGLQVILTPQNSRPPSPMASHTRRSEDTTHTPKEERGAPSPHGPPVDAAGNKLPLGPSRRRVSDDARKSLPPLATFPPTSTTAPPEESHDGDDDEGLADDVTVNQNSFLNFKKRKSYVEQPLIPEEVYQTPTSRNENQAFVTTAPKKSPTTSGPPPPYPTGAPATEAEDHKKGNYKLPTVFRVPDHHHQQDHDNLQEPPVPDILDKDGNAPVLIYPKRIDNLYRFRVLFAGLCMFIVSSLQGLHALFGLLLLDQYYRFSLTENMNIYTCGAAFGMFVLPFGILYDWFGPRPSIAIGTAMMIISEILLALCFRETIRPTYARIAVLYGLMSWGCYTLDVAVLPSVLTHMPRDKGQPTGLLKTFSGLGASFISCLYRGFFNRASYSLEDNFAALFFFCLALTVIVGFVCIWYLHDAPYVVTRWERYKGDKIVKRKLNKEKKEYTEAEVEKHEKDFNDLLKLRLKKYLIRNRYMAQLMPKRRYNIVTIILILLNFFLTIQAICAAWFASNMTPGKYRGIAIGAIIIVVLLFILVVPIRAIDEPSPQDEEIVQKAKETEEKLKNAKEERLLEEYKSEKRNRRQSERNAAAEAAAAAATNPLSPGDSISNEDVVFLEPDSALRREVLTSTENSAVNRGRRSSDARDSSVRIKKSTPIDQQTTLLELEVDDVSNVFSRTNRALAQSGDFDGPLSPEATGQYSYIDDSPLDGPLSLSATVRQISNSRFAPDPSGSDLDEESFGLQIVADKAPENDHPIIETINVCGEMFVAPLYQSSFFKSLGYVDIYLLLYTTFVMWGVGLTTTANYNIYIMLMARDRNMDYKMYILFSAMSGVFVAGGRVFIGVWERVTMILKQKKNIYITATAIYPVCSILMLIGTVLWAALPGKYILVMAYLFVSAAYGASTAVTPYIITSIFERDVGSHYGFCFLGAAIGMVIFHRLSFYQLYLQHAVPMPPILPFVGDRCIGQRKCLNNTMIVYNIFVASTLISSFWLHIRYKQLVTGKVAGPQRLLTPVVKNFFCCRGKTSSDSEGEISKKSPPNSQES